MSSVTAGYSDDSGMYLRLQELKEAEPFKPVYIPLQRSLLAVDFDSA